MNIAIKLGVGILVVIGLGYFWYQHSRNQEIYDTCLGFTVYDVDAKAWRWKLASVGEFYETKEQAIEACETRQREVR